MAKKYVFLAVVILALLQVISFNKILNDRRELQRMQQQYQLLSQEYNKLGDILRERELNRDEITAQAEGTREELRHSTLDDVVDWRDRLLPESVARMLDKYRTN